MARAKLSFSAPVTIALDCLERSENNVRRVRPAIPIRSLADSIARRGLLQSLSVRPILDDAGAETGRYRVQAGGRRLEALQLLVKEKRLAKNAPIPCMIKTDGTEEEDSLAENTDREALHPLDQFRAFAALAAKGQPIEDIAAAFSVTPAVVKQRLKLASVSPKLLELFEQDAMTLELLMAFTLSSDHARQEQVWEAIQRQSWLQSAHHVRRLLTEDTVRASHPSVLFVGITAYEAAGGFVMRDLFEEDRGGYLTDPLLLQKLVGEKLEAEAAKVRAEGWKWVEAGEDIPYNATYGLRTLVPITPALTESEAEDFENLVNERDQLEGSCEGDETADADILQRLELVKKRIDELAAKIPVFAPEDMAIAGCFVSFDSEGQLCVDRGYVRPEDDARQAPDHAPDHETAATGGGLPVEVHFVTGPSGSSSTPAEDSDDDSAALPEKLIAELTVFRTLALRDALANDPDTALLALLHALALKLIYPYRAGTCLELNAHGMLPNWLNNARQTKPAKSIEARINGWKQALPDNASDLWNFLVELGQEERKALLAQLVSMTVNAVIEPRNPGRDRIRHADQLAEMLNLDLVQAGFTPTAENYLGRVTKAEIIAAVTEACGEETASLLADLKKKDMAIEAERLLANTGWLPAPLRNARAKQDMSAGISASLGDPANDDALPAFLEEEAAA